MISLAQQTQTITKHLPKNITYKGALFSGRVSRSLNAVKIHRLVRDGHTNTNEFKQAIAEDQKEILAAQSTAQNRHTGFAFISAGQSDWLDLLRPIAHTFEGFEKKTTAGEDSIGPVTRFFRTNTFYRKPNINCKITAQGNELQSYLPKLENNGIILLFGPYTFAKLVENSFYQDEKALALDYSAAITKNLTQLKNHGYSAVLLLEPAVGYDISKNSFNPQNVPPWYKEAISEIKKSNAVVGIHFPLADAKYTIPLVENTQADFIGIDGIYTNFSYINTKKDILLGVIDGARASAESKEHILTQINLFLSNAKFSGKYYLGTNDRLWDVPFEIGLEKIKLLAALGDDLK